MSEKYNVLSEKFRISPKQKEPKMTPERLEAEFLEQTAWIGSYRDLYFYNTSTRGNLKIEKDVTFRQLFDLILSDSISEEAREVFLVLLVDNNKDLYTDTFAQKIRNLPKVAKLLHIIRSKSFNYSDEDMKRDQEQEQYYKNVALRKERMIEIIKEI
jgi:hypothetical protein